MQNSFVKQENGEAIISKIERLIPLNKTMMRIGNIFSINISALARI